MYQTATPTKKKATPTAKKQQTKYQRATRAEKWLWSQEPPFPGFYAHNTGVALYIYKGAACERIATWESIGAMCRNAEGDPYEPFAGFSVQSVKDYLAWCSCYKFKCEIIDANQDEKFQKSTLWIQLQCPACDYYEWRPVLPGSGSGSAAT